MKRFTFLLLSILIITAAFSQKRPKNKMKFGKVSLEELRMTTCDIDSTADAVILGDFNRYSLEYLPNLGIKLSIDVYRRIKILNTDGIAKMSDFAIGLYHSNGNRDKISYFKAVTYNEENGEIIETKLDKDSRFIEEEGNWDIHKFAFTNVKAGSVLEYKYSITSDYVTYLPTYHPQQDIPVLWSELYVEYIEQLEFKYFMKGRVPLSFSDHHRIEGKIQDTWIFQNIPSMEQDNFMAPVINYKTQIDYELRNINFPGQYYKEYTTTWQEVAKDAMKSDYFGGLVKKERFYKDITAHVLADSSAVTKEEQVLSAINYIRGQYQWNNQNRFYPSRDFNKVIKNKRGRSSDLNMLLLGTLHQLGITSRPLALSTRNNGILMESKPSIEDLNYLICYITIDEEVFLVDVATDYSGINALPSKCLNGKGLVLDEKHSKWVALETHMKYKRRVFVQATFDEDLMVSGSCQTKEQGYAGQSIRRSIQKEGSEEEYISKQKNGLEDYEISDYSLIDVENTQKAVGVKFSFENEELINDMGDLLTLEPILFKDFDENPFKKDTREFPIDFIYPISLDYTYMYTIPEGFVIEELPQPTRVTNSDKTIGFSLNSVARGNTITVSVKFNVDQAMYHTEQYEDLKSFFDYFVTQQKQPIVLKQL
ncbi:DUF3857 domain-containing protein [Lentimicrobium sp. S6]|uniref:DUF3857 domain-containing protein n=1 Tax=Lentimicrobium sp. S6 TaxID=2735872 RepID=UPI001551EC32|nr:DUF3857 domain-containing protein [Lentimicrobium sp. S6]NPD45726.1 DUF3857 domain-containing protein [Lentimicrobium sp. S6]